jgi:hypothetical protein
MDQMRVPPLFATAPRRSATITAEQEAAAARAAPVEPERELVQVVALDDCGPLDPPPR